MKYTWPQHTVQPWALYAALASLTVHSTLELPKGRYSGNSLKDGCYFSSNLNNCCIGVICLWSRRMQPQGASHRKLLLPKNDTETAVWYTAIPPHPLSSPPYKYISVPAYPGRFIVDICRAASCTPQLSREISKVCALSRPLNVASHRCTIVANDNLLRFDLWNS